MKIGDLVQVKAGERAPRLHRLVSPLTVIGVDVDSIIAVRDANGVVEKGWYDFRFETYVAPKAPKPKRVGKKKPNSRQQQVLEHLLSGKTLTQGEAIILGYGTRIAVAVDRLREAGHDIVTTMKRDLHGISYGEYSLAKRTPFGKRVSP